MLHGLSWFSVSPDTSRCVAEKKYTEQQAKKLFPQVFVPVCNPDGTYSEVGALLKGLEAALWESFLIVLKMTCDLCSTNDLWSINADR